MQNPAQQPDANLLCLICTQLAIEAVQTQCCGQLMCQQCCDDILKKGHHLCPMCRVELEVKKSVLARRLISTIKVDCVDGCGIKVEVKGAKEHQRRCGSRVVACRECGGKVRQGELVQHMGEQHQDKLYEICLSYNLDEHSSPQQSSLKKSSQPQPSNKSRAPLAKQTNALGRTCHIGTTNKYYCGQKSLLGKCQCCDGHCGPTNGENCDQCMELDVRRHNLERGCLVNPDGSVAQYNERTKVYTCGRYFGASTCAVGAACKACKRLTNSVIIGRYKKLI